MKKILTITIIFLGVFILGYLLYKQQNLQTNGNISFSCDSSNKEDVYGEVRKIENNFSTYTFTTKDIIGQSTEGGEQTDYVSNGKVVFVKQTFFGETGKSEVYYYLSESSVFYIKKENIEYLLPLSEDPSAKTKTIETKEFFLNADQELCSWYKNKVLQVNDSDTQDLLEYLLTGIKRF